MTTSTYAGDLTVTGTGNPPTAGSDGTVANTEVSKVPARRATSPSESGPSGKRNLDGSGLRQERA